MSADGNTPPAPLSGEAAPRPDTSTALQFLAALFPSGGSVHFRSVPEPKDGRTPNNHHYQLDHNFPAVLADFLEWCAVDSRAAFYLPAAIPPGKTKAEDVVSLPAVLADLDKGDTLANLAAIESLIGPASIVVESGGATETGAPKLHVYHVLNEPATGAAIGTACRVREVLAERFNGDRSFQQAGQVIRLVGSIHLKSAPKLVRLRSIGGARYSLATISAALGIAVASPQAADTSFFNFNNVVPLRESNVDRALTAPVRAEGADGITRFEAAGSAIGHFVRMIREGRMTEDEAWTATKGWNLATLQPPWTEERLRQDFDRLYRIDREAHGPVAKPFTPAAPAEGWHIDDWKTRRFVGRAPARVWSVNGVLPAGTAGIFAAVGDAGKSMMALKLGLDITTAPPMTDGLAFPPRFMGGDVTARGAVVMLTSEDDAEEVHRRLEALDPTSEHAKSNQLRVVPMISAGGARAIITEGRDGVMPTPFWYTLRSQLLAIPDLRLVILDPLSAFVGGDTNDNMLGAALMLMLGHLAYETKASVMLIHHFAKGKTPATLNEAREAIRGAGSFVDNGRWAIAMWEADEDTTYKALKALGQKERARAGGIVYRGGLAKGNAPGEKVIRTLVRNASTGLLEDVTEQLRSATPRQEDIDDAVFQALAAERAEDPRFSFACSRNSLWDACHHVLTKRNIEIAKDALPGVIERLKADGRVVKCPSAGSRWEPKIA